MKKEIHCSWAVCSISTQTMTNVMIFTSWTHKLGVAHHHHYHHQSLFPTWDWHMQDDNHIDANKGYLVSKLQFIHLLCFSDYQLQETPIRVYQRKAYFLTTVLRSRYAIQCKSLILYVWMPRNNSWLSRYVQAGAFAAWGTCFRASDWSEILIW